MHRTDNLDARISRELGGNGFFQWNARLSYAEIAKKIGADEGTVRYRVKRGQRSGAIQKVELVLNPHLIGREAAAIELEVDDPERKQDGILKLKMIDGVTFILDFEGRLLRAVIFFESERSLDRRLRLITAIFGSRTKGGPNTFPPVRHKMTVTDWKILKALRKDPRSSLSDVATEVRTSIRTVKRRLGLMTDSMSFFLVIVPDLKKMMGVACNFLIYCSSVEKKKVIDSALRGSTDNVVFLNTTERGYSVLTAACDNLQMVDEMQKRFEHLDGVQKVVISVLKQFILVTESMDEAIEQELSRVAA